MVIPACSSAEQLAPALAGVPPGRFCQVGLTPGSPFGPGGPASPAGPDGPGGPAGPASPGAPGEPMPPSPLPLPTDPQAATARANEPASAVRPNARAA